VAFAKKGRAQAGLPTRHRPTKLAGQRDQSSTPTSAYARAGLDPMQLAGRRAPRNNPRIGRVRPRIGTRPGTPGTPGSDAVEATHGGNDAVKMTPRKRSRGNVSDAAAVKWRSRGKQCAGAFRHPTQQPVRSVDSLAFSFEISAQADSGSPISSSSLSLMQDSSCLGPTTSRIKMSLTPSRISRGRLRRSSNPSRS